jgi:hypothetical protein
MNAQWLHDELKRKNYPRCTAYIGVKVGKRIEVAGYATIEDAERSFEKYISVQTETQSRCLIALITADKTAISG